MNDKAPARAPRPGRHPLGRPDRPLSRLPPGQAVRGLSHARAALRGLRSRLRLRRFRRRAGGLRHPHHRLHHRRRGAPRRSVLPAALLAARDPVGQPRPHPAAAPASVLQGRAHRAPVQAQGRRGQAGLRLEGRSMPTQRTSEAHHCHASWAWRSSIGLGVWQLQRLEWKEGLIARIEARTRARAPDPRPRHRAGREGRDPSYIPVRAEGRFHHTRERYLYALSLDGEPGWHVITPLETVKGTMVLVDRGFVPERLARPRNPARGPDPGGGDRDRASAQRRDAEHLRPRQRT